MKQKLNITDKTNSYHENNLGFGIDVLEIKRIVQVIDRTPSFITKVFTKKELDYCNSHAVPAIHFATHFAGKEAVAKALGTGLVFSPKKIEILHKKSGQPYVLLYDKALEIFNTNHLSYITLSLSYTHTEAISCAILFDKTNKNINNYSESENILKEIDKQFKQLKNDMDFL